MSIPARLLGSSLSSFGVVAFAGLVVGALGLGAAVTLSLGVLIPLASACLQACIHDPTMMSLARGSASLCIATVGSGLVAGAVVLASQLRSTRRLVSQVEVLATRPPRRLESLASELEMEGRLTYVDDPAPYAFCYGFLSPRVCISSGMVKALSTEELRAVLLHEGCHLRRRDPLKVLISRSMAGALFLMPLVADLRDRYLMEKELAADAHVVERMSPQPLAAALLKICRSANQQPVAALAAAAVGPFNVIGARIRHLAEPREGLAPLRAGRIAVSLAVVALALAATFGSAYAAERTLYGSGACCATGTCSLPTSER